MSSAGSAGAGYEAFEQREELTTRLRNVLREYVPLVPDAAAPVRPRPPPPAAHNSTGCHGRGRH